MEFVILHGCFMQFELNCFSCFFSLRLLLDLVKNSLHARHDCDDSLGVIVQTLHSCSIIDFASEKVTSSESILVFNSIKLGLIPILMHLIYRQY